jgi:D-serine deaminase-like pyridoxal phosphate-dependent protein
LRSDLAALETPRLLLSKTRLDRNIERMRARLAGFGVPLRPHIKTAKSVEVYARALGDAGVTVSTLQEAEYALRNGETDILYAVGISPNKLARAVALQSNGADLILTVDSMVAAQSVDEAGRAAGLRLPAVIEIDSDDHRAGVKPSSEDAGRIARFLADAGGASYRGLMTHAGGSYDCRSIDDIRAMAERERRAVVDTAAMLARGGIGSEIVSVGSTPTATFGKSFEGVSEVRAGVYMFQDLVMAGLQCCAIDDIALSVLTSVIGVRADKRRLIVDAGWMALSRDRGTASQAVDQGYGLVCDLAGAPIGGLIVVAANQEHGLVARRDGAAFDVSRFPVGTMLRILPNHACATAAQHDRYTVIDESGALLAEWPRCNGWGAG